MKVNGDLDQMLGAAYLALLSIPFDSPSRIRLQPVLAGVRDEIAEVRGIEPDGVQTAFESFINAPAAH